MSDSRLRRQTRDYVQNQDHDPSRARQTTVVVIAQHDLHKTEVGHNHKAVDFADDLTAAVHILVGAVRQTQL